jgi:hypothetical protein
MQFVSAVLGGIGCKFTFDLVQGESLLISPRHSTDLIDSRRSSYGRSPWSNSFDTHFMAIRRDSPSEIDQDGPTDVSGRPAGSLDTLHRPNAFSGARR